MKLAIEQIILIQERLMAKEKYHTSHHHERRYHKHGIKKPKKTRYTSLAGVRLFLITCQCNLKFLRNRRRAIQFDKKQNKHYKPKVKRVVKAVKKVAPPAKKEGKKEAKKVAPKKKQQALIRTLTPLHHILSSFETSVHNALQQHNAQSLSSLN
eukprot:TRINITY_DN3716_c0_g1_i1.p4 TRINITY_DN3716_c0_g1~~TRINITY_DN3716_c0_g1_i1.p4  ORF type:complete len:154 (+),score=3.82 TRINITY_DN3716_c0_g1_i1:1341-1802(+)